VVVGEIKGIINPVMAGYVDRVITDAERTNAPAVVFYMDTPGGLSEAMREINLRILASRVPVIVYVAPDGARAGSAGVYISYAAHLVAMAPATNIGSATPVASVPWPSSAVAILTSPSAPSAKAPTCRPAKRSRGT
jgi:membrane-bound serine protease (ClpP class)